MQKETIDEIICNNSIIKDPKQITDKFNHFFANVGVDLANKNISPVAGKFTQFLYRPVTPNQFSLNLQTTRKSNKCCIP